MIFISFDLPSTKGRILTFVAAVFLFLNAAALLQDDCVASFGR